MSITVRSYTSTDGLCADIRYNKGCLAPELTISQEGRTIYRNTYMTIDGARRAMNRFSTHWTLDK